MQNMWRTKMVLSLVAISLLSFSTEAYAQQQTPSQSPRQTSAKADLSGLNVTGPFKSGNLAVYLIHGKDAVPNQKMLTLSEALAQKKVVVHETGSVNQLSVENLGNETVFIQSGDIVKGGQQDRTLQSDLVLQPKSGNIPVNSFCVEHGRWTQRGNESRSQFNGSYNMLASKGLKIAARSAKNQGDVWNEVSVVQRKLESKAAAKRAGLIAAPASPSSLQLTLESGGVKKLSEKYVSDLSPVASGKNDTIGYAFAVNGKINSVDVYSSHDLFSKLWGKLVTASAQEAAAENEEGKAYTPPPVAEVKKYISETETSGTESKEKLPGKLVVLRRESPKNLYFETQGEGQVSAGKQVWYHKNFIAK